LNWPQATFASQISIENNHATVQRETDSGLQTLRLALPAVITTDLRLNTPRFAKLPDIMKAKSKPLETLSAESLEVDLTSLLATKMITAPTPRKAGIRVTSVDELLEKLRNEAKVI
jgi:electron transfer flavoprotein beta subunit